MLAFIPYRICRWLLLVAGVLCMTEISYAQRINFSTWTGSEEISVIPVAGIPMLKFDQRPLTANMEAVSIKLTDNQAVAFRIEAPEGFDLTVEIAAPTQLRLDGSGTTAEKVIPFTVGMAYNNLMAADEATAKTGAIQLPAGFYNITFPVNRRTAGAPGPPPTPISGTYVRPKATAWLFLYGELGPIGNVNAGDYTGEITISVYFTSND
jgi:hypothetical protein